MRSEMRDLITRRIRCLLRAASSPRKVAMLRIYRGSSCDVLGGGRWSPFTGLVPRPMFLMSAWNPFGQRTSRAANARADARFVRVLRRIGIKPIRTRGHDVAPPEFGWMVPHQRERSLALMRAFGQLAGIVVHGEAKQVLWVDGSRTRMESDAA